MLGVSWEETGQLAWLDARTLQPSGRRVAIGPPPTGVAARSADGRTIALSSGVKPELQFVDVRALRVTGRLAIRGTGSLRESIWPSPNRLVAVRSGVDAEVVVVDPRARRVLERRPLEGQPLSVVPAGRRLVALFAPQGAIGQARLAVIDENASVRTLPLPRVHARARLRASVGDERGCCESSAGRIRADASGGCRRWLRPGGDSKLTAATATCHSPLMSATVDSLLDEYHRRYSERDAEGVTDLCLWPFLAVRRGEAIHLLDRDAVRDHFASAVQAYRFTGVASWRRVETEVRQLGEHSVFVTVNWNTIDPQGKVLRDSWTSYQMLATSGGLRFLSYTNHF